MCKEKLEWNDVFVLLDRDKGGRFVISDKTPDSVSDYLGKYRTPSRAYPYSYAKALLTKKFVKHIKEVDKELSKELGL